MHRTNSDSIRSCPCFRVFRLNFVSDFFNLLLVRFHQAKIIVVKHLIQGRNKKAWVGVEPSIMAFVKTTLRTTWPRCRLTACVQGDPKKTEPNSNYSKYTGSVFFGSPCILILAYSRDPR